MFKVELSFDMERLDVGTVEKMCARTDEIFEREDLKCADRKPGRRIYLDKGRKQDYGRFWAAIFALKDTSWVVEHLKECNWYNGSGRENLITDFLRN